MARHSFQRKVMAFTNSNKHGKYWSYLECGHKLLMDERLTPPEHTFCVDCNQCRDKKTAKHKPN